MSDEEGKIKYKTEDVPSVVFQSLFGKVSAGLLIIFFTYFTVCVSIDGLE